MKDVSLVDASPIRGLAVIREEDSVLEIGSLATHMDILKSVLLQETAPCLIEAVGTIGCPQTRHAVRWEETW